MDKITELKKCDYLSDISDDQYARLAEVACEEQYEVGQSLTRQGRSAERVYLIVEGLVGLYLELGPMSHRLVQSAANGQMIGWGSIAVPPRRSTATAKAIETTRVLAFDSNALKALFEKDALLGCRFYRAALSAVTTRLMNAYTQLMGVTIHDA